MCICEERKAERGEEKLNRTMKENDILTNFALMPKFITA